MKKRAIPSRRQQGQAMVEYALILLMLSLAVLVPLPTTRFAGHDATVQNPMGFKDSFMGACIEAYRDYYRAHYFVLNLPFP